MLDQGQVIANSSTVKVIEDYISRAFVAEGFVQAAGIQSLYETDEIRVMSISIEQEGQNTNSFLTHLPIEYSIVYELKRPLGPGLRVGFDLLNYESSVLFRSFNDDDSLHNDVISLPGIYMLRCIIPPNFLRSGIHFVLPIAGIHGQRWIFSDRWKIAIEMIQPAGTNSSYTDQRPGVIMPLLEWATTYDNTIVGQG